MEDDIFAKRSGFERREVVRHSMGEVEQEDDCVAEEVPVALVFNGISHVVMMATPCDIEELAVGFALSEGIVDSRSQILDLETLNHEAAIEVQMTIAQSAFMRLKERRRSLAGRTGCGVCGIESLELLDLEPGPMTLMSLPEPLGLVIERAVREFSQFQVLMRKTGGVHAAAWCDRNGAVIRVFEDVGRHNALDKLIGYLALRRVGSGDGFVFISSRASYELARKTARMNIPLLATISAPTTLAIDIAQKAGLKLVSFCRANGFVEYTGTRASPFSSGSY